MQSCASICCSSLLRLMSAYDMKGEKAKAPEFKHHLDGKIGARSCICEEYIKYQYYRYH